MPLTQILGKDGKIEMKKVSHANASENVPDLTQRERTLLRRTFGKIRLSPQKTEEITQKICEHQAKKGTYQGTNEGEATD